MSHKCPTCNAVYKNQSSLSRHNRDKQHGSHSASSMADSDITQRHQYIYLLREREFINNNLDVYKIGRTHQELTKRFNKYPKGSQLILHITCTDNIKAEAELLKQFRAKFKPRTDIGSEYFEGSADAMKELIYIYDQAETKNIENTREAPTLPQPNPNQTCKEFALISQQQNLTDMVQRLSLYTSQSLTQVVSIRNENGTTHVPIGGKWF